MRSIISTAVWLACSTVVIATTTLGPVANMTIANQVISPDGFKRAAVLAGVDKGSVRFPGPLITAKKGDQFRLNVTNKLNDKTMLTNTSIHWHGLFQKGSSWADGPIGVTQCPINRNESFLYQFSAQDQVGTYWYHSHDSTQYCDGLRGGLVIYDPNDPFKSMYDIDDESTVITLADWYHIPAPDLSKNPNPKQFNATLINGLGRYPNGIDSPLSVIKVFPNKRYRFRLISISCDPNFVFSIDKHDMTIIEVDGVNVKPLTVDSIHIFAGQRYSFILKADQKPSNYWVRALPNFEPFDKYNTIDFGRTPFAHGLNSAILQYGGQTGSPNYDIEGKGIELRNPMLETNLHPFVHTTVPGHARPGGADYNLDLNILLITPDTGSKKELPFYTVEGKRFIPSLEKPILLQLLRGVALDDLMTQGSIFKLAPNKVVELSIPGGSLGSPHPMHLHGHNFHVVRSANSKYYNYYDPVIRDVVNIGDSCDNVTIRFTTDNSGPWVLHCHIDWHFEQGLAVAFAEDIPGIRNNTHPPMAWQELCTGPVPPYN